MSGRYTVIDHRRPARAAGVDRREALALLMAGAAAAMSGCSRPREVIEPFAEDPATYAQGLTSRYATTLTLGGYGRGVLARVRDGRPYKLDGNPRHPASLGATDVFAEAAILDLFDPQRSKGVWSPDGPAAWEAAARVIPARLAKAGEGARLLTGRITSPTTLQAIARLQARYPGLQWRRYEPVNDDAAMAGAAQAYGRPLTLRPRFAEARTVVCLDADPLGPGPDQVANGAGFARLRRPEQGPVSHWYVFEPSLTITGACADARAALQPALVRNVALTIAQALGAPAGGPLDLPPHARDLAQAAARDLAAQRGHAVVLAGPGQPAEVHALCAWINGQLQAPLDAIAPVDPIVQGHADSLASLAAEMHAGKVGSLLILDCNPVYDAPAALGFADAMKRVSFAVQAGLYRDETGAQTPWHLPLSHALESFADARATDGSASLSQPLVHTLYDTRTPAELIDLLANPTGTAARDLVQAAWRDQAGGDAQRWWRQSLISGVIEGSAAKPAPPPAAKLPILPPARAAAGLVFTTAPSTTVWDGSRANNAWLQECPEALSKEVWGASLRISRADADRLGVTDGQVVQLSAAGASLKAPVHIAAGQASGVVTLPMGYGHTADGTIATGLGANAHALRPHDLGWAVDGVAFAATKQHAPTPSTPSDVRISADTADLFPVLDEGKRTRPEAVNPTLIPARPPVPQREPAWAMVIDTSVCIGCNACVVSCQSENNIPVIGADEIRANRDMHWLRIDRYDTGTEEDPRPGFQPVPCMHCEAAPCEPVCPVEASVHDSEGLNVQVYNRCIGTRFCEANCPYKVRRFNFKDYENQARIYPVPDARSIEAQHNPEVSVRARGVMEKCTYCVQRISAARRESEKSGQPIPDGAVKTACQQACPTNAIVFGDLHDPNSEVSRLKESGRHYVLLEDLGTRPRTTYLAKVRVGSKGGEG